jgi:energy-coupling factor transporter ATP-binding protein EcfA2
MLAKLKPVHMDEYDRPICLPKTRSDAVKFITEWMSNDSGDRKKVLWLYGMAGSGKSTLSTTIAELVRNLQRLGGFFFFNRDVPERNAATLIRTLAYQLAQFDTQIASAMSSIVESNTNIAAMPLDFQFANLLSDNAMTDVKWSRGTILLVIDALDEAGSEKDRRALLHALSNGFRSLPPFVQIIITSRQETDIEHAFASHPFVESYNIDGDTSATTQDILEFLRHRLAEIRSTNKYLPFESDWPNDDRIRALGNNADGSFIWASTACLYIDSHDPRLRLDELIIPSSSHASPFISFANLDRLYHTGLSSAGIWADHAFCSDSRDILGMVLCARIPLSCDAIDALLTLPRPCLQSISRLRCFLRGGETEPIRILHPSFHDYLIGRCNGEPWFINIEQHNESLAFRCMELLKCNLRENICGLTLPHPVEDETLSEALSYACKFWVEHVCHISCITDTIGEQILQFLNVHLLHWIEAMSLIRSHGRTIRLLEELLDWLRVCFPSCDPN